MGLREKEANEDGMARTSQAELHLSFTWRSGEKTFMDVPIPPKETYYSPTDLNQPPNIITTTSFTQPNHQHLQGTHNTHVYTPTHLAPSRSSLSLRLRDQITPKTTQGRRPTASTHTPGPSH